ncbi:signal transduction histidine kinase [Bacillus mesophilus]|uniref:histidine kinase n=1 Tax=Bacillus mesophilus TaxID=1808955 RepID=A0A6M0QBZ1_9BACI|nr:HAMP domain-containing sensor histidine kinase [Bacillus mesophilus]MBM7660153.1 signal transduction histidine kinase [Bacillus mesophilus]NEY73806.1 HAMP domain-containing histidine kinase [Bacillus mesophilus]
MNKISVKLGVLFFIVILLLESIFSLYLFFSLQESRIKEEIEELRGRGNSHRNVLEKNYNEETIHHVALMETEAETDVVITDESRNIIAASMENETYINYVNRSSRIERIPREGVILEARWRTNKYLAIVTPIENKGNIVGFVYMFRGSESMVEMTKSLRNHFLTVGTVIVLLSMISIAIFTKLITNPLVIMKKATEKLSQGDFTVTLNMSSKDELGQLAGSIEKLAQDLNHLKKERNEFLASIAHELRTPLTYIKGYADVASQKNISEEDREQYLKIIKEEIQHLSRLINNLFDLARVDQNHFQVKKQKVNISHFIQRIIVKVTPAFEQNQIRLSLSGSDVAEVEIDTERFEQVLTNLLDNSLKYSDNNTFVEINVSGTKHDVFITIKDQGVGIPKEDLPYIFDRLYRVEKSRSRVSGGTGLGLSIAKEIVEAHGGEISVKSHVHEGTLITIRMDRCLG